MGSRSHGSDSSPHRSPAGRPPGSRGDSEAAVLTAAALPIRPVFMALDHAVHTLPSVVLITRLVQQNRHVPQMNALFSLILSTWFAFRQSAKLDSSDIYVPHPWRRTWLAILVSALSTPALVNSLIAKSSRRTAIIGLVRRAGRRGKGRNA